MLAATNRRKLLHDVWAPKMPFRVGESSRPASGGFSRLPWIVNKNIEMGDEGGNAFFREYHADNHVR